MFAFTGRSAPVAWVIGGLRSVINFRCVIATKFRVTVNIKIASADLPIMVASPSVASAMPRVVVGVPRCQLLSE